MATKSTRRYAQAGRRTAEEQRRIQDTKQAKAAKNAKGSKGGGAAKRAVQPPGRRYAEPPLPKQQQRKPGLESELEPRPMYRAPDRW